MKRVLLHALCAVLAAAPLRAATDSEVAARRVALTLAGAFANDGFTVRDGHWIGVVSREAPTLVEVNLYAGNQYWFSAGASVGTRRLAVSVFDETGAPVEIAPYRGGARAAAGFAPEVSGPYYVRLDLLRGESATVCLTYSYK